MTCLTPKAFLFVVLIETRQTNRDKLKYQTKKLSRETDHSQDRSFFSFFFFSSFFIGTQEIVERNSLHASLATIVYHEGAQATMYVEKNRVRLKDQLLGEWLESIEVDISKNLWGV